MKTFAALALSALLAACGGGGDDGSEQPNVSIQPPNCAASSAPCK